MKASCLLILLLLGLVGRVTAAEVQGKEVVVGSLLELAEAAVRNGQAIRMKPGTYQITDVVPHASVPARRKAGQFELFVFRGNGNTFDCTGVTIEVDTTLRSALRPPVHTNEFVVAGNGNTIQGLTIVHRGDGSSPGGAALAITGTGNTLRDCTLHVRGSFPYGYGDLFGKGGGDIIGHRKKSGVLITGNDTTVVGCNLHMRSFGHGFFIQKDAANVRFEDCAVEGAMRATDEMLAETEGPAFKVGFRTVVKTRNGENRIQPGYMKSLSEDGFRTYGTHANLSFKNCRVKNMRGGFELRSKTAPKLEGCTATGNERGFWVSDGAQLVACRGDAEFGPLLFVEGTGANVQLELLPTESEKTVHVLASIHGSGHTIAITESASGKRRKPRPILLGFGQPMMGDGMAAISESRTRNVMLRNATDMPAVISAKAEGGEVITRGPAQENRGKGVKITALAQ